MTAPLGISQAAEATSFFAINAHPLHQCEKSGLGLAFAFLGDLGAAPAQCRSLSLGHRNWRAQRPAFGSARVPCARIGQAVSVLVRRASVAQGTSAYALKAAVPFTSGLCQLC